MIIVTAAKGGPLALNLIIAHNRPWTTPADRRNRRHPRLLVRQEKLARSSTSVRRIKLAMPSAFPYQAEYRAAHAALTTNAAA